MMGTNSDCPACGKHPCIHEVPLMDCRDSLLRNAPGEVGQYSALIPEPITVIESWRLPHHLACALKYIARHERKGGIEDLNKAVWYIERYIRFKERCGGNDKP